MIVMATCRACGDSVAISVLIEEYEDFADGGVRHGVFTTLSEAESEMLISGECGLCFDDPFDEEND